MRKSTALLGLLCVGCAALAAWTGWQLRTERDYAATLERQLAAQARNPSALPSPVEPAPQARVSPVQSPKPAAAPAVASADPETARQEEVRQYLLAAQEREREMMRDPAYRKSRVDEFRRRASQTRADYIRVLGMTPEQADRVIGLSIERNFKVMELAGYRGEAPSQEAQAEIFRLDNAQNEEMRSLLGDEKYARWKWYQASGQERYDANQFRAQLSTTEHALQDQQVDALVEALYSAHVQRSREYDEYAKAAGITDRRVVSPADRQRWLDLEKDANQRIHEAMAQTLSQAQLASLDDMLASNLGPVEAALRLQEQP
jgi:hypothetical protein